MPGRHGRRLIRVRRWHPEVLLAAGGQQAIVSPHRRRAGRCAVATVAAADGIRAALTPAADYFGSLGVPDWLVRARMPCLRMSVCERHPRMADACSGWQRPAAEHAPADTTHCGASCY